MLLTPSAGINCNRQRVRHEGVDEQRETVGAASALRNKCKQMVKRADTRGLVELQNIVENPIDAYNTSRVGLSVSSLEELATFAHMRLPDISQRAKGGAGKHGTQQVVDGCQDGLRLAAQRAVPRPSDEVSHFLSGPILQARRDRCLDLRGCEVQQGARLPHSRGTSRSLSGTWSSSRL